MVNLRIAPNSNRVLHIKGNVCLKMLKKRLQSKKEEKVKITFFSFYYAHIENGNNNTSVISHTQFVRLRATLPYTHANLLYVTPSNHKQQIYHPNLFTPRVTISMHQKQLG